LLVAAVWEGTLYTNSGNDFVNYFYGDNLICYVNQSRGRDKYLSNAELIKNLIFNEI